MTVYSVDGDVIAVVVDSDVVGVWGLGTRGAVRAAMMALIAVGFATGLLAWARAKAAAQGGWWSVDGRHELHGSPWATVFLLPAALAVLAMGVGISPWPVWVAVWGVAMVGIMVVRPPTALRSDRRPPRLRRQHHRNRN